MANSGHDAVTTAAFWDSHWEKVAIPSEYDPSFNNDRAIGDIIARYVPPRGPSPKKAIEIGCAPGKWMLFLLRRVGYEVHGCEYLLSGAEKTRQNFEHFQIAPEKYRIFTGDFFSMNLEHDYDLVLSLGFVEHFKDFRGVMERQLILLKRGGLLVVGLPRFVGVNWLIQATIDKFTSERLRRYLPVHNLHIMNRWVFSRFAESTGCEVLFNDYIGGFETALFPVNNVQVAPVRAILNRSISLIARLKWLQKAWYVASYQICVLRKM